ncbi:MAG TPA: porin [Terracidiphilus sp.]|nr:porin [Terracidiphilus sp.]
MNYLASVRKALVLGMSAAGIVAAAQTQTPSTPAAPAPAAPAAAAPADATPKPWRVAGLDVSGFLDGYYSYNANDPTEAANGKMNDLYNFNQDANQPGFSAAKLTLNHDPAPIGAHFDFVYGRTNRLINAPNQFEFVEQAYVSAKPPKAKGLELDLGKFVTSAGAEVIEAKDNWNYSRSLLFAWAIPYWHFGLRSSIPVTKTETVGVQVVNGWNNMVHDTGGVTVGLTSALTEAKYALNLNVYTGPANTPGQNAYRNLVDATLLLTPNSKFNAYINFDFGNNKNSVSHGVGASGENYWDGIAVAAHEQVTGATAFAGRLEVFDDQQGYSTGLPQTVKEFTGTYERKLKYGLISRAEFRRDWSDAKPFHTESHMVNSQTTATVGVILVLTPKR